MAKSTTPGLFSNASDREQLLRPTSATTRVAAKANLPRLVLPRDLPNAIKRLEDQELERLVAVSLAEQKRRGRGYQASEQITRERRAVVTPTPLTLGKMNAVRAAFKAGV